MKFKITIEPLQEQENKNKSNMHDEYRYLVNGRMSRAFPNEQVMDEEIKRGLMLRLYGGGAHAIDIYKNGEWIATTF